MFKSNFNIDILYNLLKEVCEEYKDGSFNYYILDNISFKKLEYHNLIDGFKQVIEPYYINSKKFYINRKLDYNKFATVIRQICKFYKIQYINKIIYDKSKYYIKYYILIT